VADSQDQGEKKPVAWPDDLVEDPVLVDLVGGVVRGRHKHSLGSQVGLDDDGGNSQEEVLDEDRDEHNKGLQEPVRLRSSPLFIDFVSLCLIISLLSLSDFFELSLFFSNH